MVEARGSLEELSAKAHVSQGEKTKKERGRDNNILMQDIMQYFLKTKKMYYSYLHLFSDFEKHKKWSKQQ